MISSKRYYQNQQSTTTVTTTSGTSGASLSWRYYNTMHGDDGYSPRCSSRMSSLWVQGHNPYTVDGTGGMTELLSKCRSVQHRNGSARTQTISRPLVLHFMTSRPDRMSALVFVIPQTHASRVRTFAFRTRRPRGSLAVRSREILSPSGLSEGRMEGSSKSARSSSVCSIFRLTIVTIPSTP